MSKKERDDFQRGRESTHSEMEQLRALAKEAGEALEMVQSRYIPSCDALPQKARTIHHDARDQVESILTKLRAVIGD